MRNIKALLAEEEVLLSKIREAVAGIPNEIVENIRHQSLDGVQQISASPAIAVVKLSTLHREGTWAPDAFIPQVQANAVERKLRTCTTLKAMVSSIQEMVDTRQVKLSSKETVRLNSKTVEILKEALQ